MKIIYIPGLSRRIFLPSSIPSIPAIWISASRMSDGPSVPDAPRKLSPSGYVRSSASTGSAASVSLTREDIFSRIISSSSTILILIIYMELLFPVFLSLPYALRQQVFDLPVDGAEIILCPGCDGIVQLCGKP